MRIFFLGVGAAVNSTAFKASCLIEGRYLVDVPPEAATILNRHRLPLSELSGIFVTHLHGDHFLGLPLLLAEFLVNESRGEKLRICGPLGLERATRQLLAISYPEVNPDKFIAKSMAVFEVLTPTATVTFDDISLEVIPVVHGSIQSFGFYIQGGDASLFVSGDTVLCQEVLENVRKADYSIVDATTELERLPTHMNLDDLKNLQAKLSGSQHIFATHRTFLNDPLMSKVIFPNDFETYELRGKCKPLLIEER